MVALAHLWRFVGEVRRQYRAENAYHNFRHALDVAATCAGLLSRVAAFAGLSAREEFATLLAALCHDVEHPGVNNAFVVAARHPLARTYNDASVLESRHAAALFDLLALRPELDVLSHLPAREWRAVRANIIGAILHTDMIHHFPMISKVCTPVSQAVRAGALIGAGGGPIATGFAGVLCRRSRRRATCGGLSVGPATCHSSMQARNQISTSPTEPPASVPRNPNNLPPLPLSWRSFVNCTPPAWQRCTGRRLPMPGPSGDGACMGPRVCNGGLATSRTCCP